MRWFLLFLTVSLTTYGQNGLHVTSDAQLFGDGTIYLSDLGLTNSGEITLNSIAFNGTSGATIHISNSNDFQVDHLTLSGNNDFETDGNLIIGTLELIDTASLLLNSGAITIETEIAGESNDRSILGKPSTSISVVKDAGVMNRFGNIGVVLLNADSALGITTVVRQYSVLNIDGTESISRWYHMIPTNNTNLNAKLEFYFYADDLGAHNVNELVLYKSIDSGSTWTNEGGALMQTPNEYFIQKDGVQDVSIWAIAENNGTLSIDDLNSNNISLFPIPAKDILYIEKPKELDIDAFEIIDGMGRMMSSGQLNGRNYITTSFLASGLYFLRFTVNEQRLKSKKFLKN